MDKKNLQHINDILSAKTWLKLTEPVSESSEPVLTGKIEVPTAKETLSIDIFISPDFPAGKIIFRCTNIAGYQHQMYDGSLCLTAPPAKLLVDKLELELEKLQLWVSKYYIEETMDTHFEYYSFKQQAPIPIVFEEDETKTLPKNRSGRFNYSLLNEKNVDQSVFYSFIALDLGGRECRWSHAYSKGLKKKYQGLWVYLDKPPVITRRKTIEDWKDLLNVMSSQQTDFIYSEYKNLANHSFFPLGFFVMVGYNIPGPKGSEIHWEAVIIRFDEFPYTAEKIAPRTYAPKDLGYKVEWCRSTNASYGRMFGRGKSPNALTDAKILIIGVGAIGSNLFASLVRGGCKHIDIRDGEPIEPGNICRAQFNFIDTYFRKTDELEMAALSISPYVEIKTGKKIEPISKANDEYKELRKQLMEYDYIFDCSTDKYLSIMLDEMELRGNIINFSITNEAQHFVSVSGNGNIHLVKSSIYDRLSPETEPFFVATGCWHPTFKASFVDINVLLSCAVIEISQRLESGRSIESFVVSKQASEGKVEYKLDYHA